MHINFQISFVRYIFIIEQEDMVETTAATTPRRDSGELPFDIHPVADLVVNITLPVEVQ